MQEDEIPEEIRITMRKHKDASQEKCRILSSSITGIVFLYVLFSEKERHLRCRSFFYAGSKMMNSCSWSTFTSY